MKKHYFRSKEDMIHYLNEPGNIAVLEGGRLRKSVPEDFKIEEEQSEPSISDKIAVCNILIDQIIAPFYRGSIFEGNLGIFFRDTYPHRFDEATEQILEWHEANKAKAIRVREKELLKATAKVEKDAVAAAVREFAEKVKKDLARLSTLSTPAALLEEVVNSILAETLESEGKDK